MPLSTLASSTDLSPHLNNPNWLIFDVRHDLQNPTSGRDAYAAGHIPGAVFLHLDNDLSGPKTGLTGRHPLPDRAQFAEKMASLGVNATTQIAVYDAHGGMYAARLWWMLRWIGHTAVAVLDGGYPAWLSAGGTTAQAVPASRAPGNLLLGESLCAQVCAQDVMANLLTKKRLVLDARAPDRFRGENETLDAVGGHIPGAINRFFRDNLQADGYFKTAAQLHAEFSAILAHAAPNNLIMQCGSGVTACHNILAMHIADLPGAALYPGSWSEWCTDSARPVATGEA